MVCFLEYASLLLLFELRNELGRGRILRDLHPCDQNKR